MWVIGGLVAILILGIGGGLFWFGKNGWPAMPSFFTKNSTTITPTLIPGPTSTTTPDPRVISVRNQHLYLFVKSEKTWHDARDYCATQGGYLATIQDAAENEMVANLLAGNAWLGATDEVEEGTWVWVSGEPWGYTNWNKDSNQPDNDQDQEHYLEFEMRRGAHRPSDWNDKPGTEKKYFICEWEPSNSSSTTTITPSPTPKTSAFYEPILTYIESQSPTFEDDFSTIKNQWGNTSEGVPVSEMIKVGILSISKSSNENLTFPTNGFLNAADFAIQFDVTFRSDTTVTNLALQLRSSKDQLSYYEIIFFDKSYYAFTNAWQFFDIKENKSKMTASGFTAITDERKQVLIVVKQGNLAIFFNDSLLLEREDVNLTGQENFFVVSAEPSDGYIWMDNIKFWNLSGVDFSASSGTTAITPSPTPKASATPDTKILNARILNPANQHLYLYIEQTKTWSDARDYCAEQGGYLVTIQDATENVYVYSLTEEGWAWLGATDEVNEGTWVWVSGEPWKYSTWAYQQPSGDDYLTYKAGLAGDNNWDDVVLDSRPFICEWDSATTTSSPETQISPKDGMIMAYVPAGEFAMGSDSGGGNEKPVHTVYLDSFWMDQTEVTNRMYALCVSAGICKSPKALNSYSRSSYYDNSDFENYPVLYVDWEMASTYCTWAERRLSTEAEWEKAARGPANYTYPWGEETGCDKVNAVGCKGETSSVGEYELGKSPYGVFDMAGNVMEWVADWYSATYYQSSPRENPIGPSSGVYHVLRGGSWKSIEYSLRSSYRLGLTPDPTNLYLIGFRCALGTTP
jgi:formylglycine-generating enzyme required for sulfatase activity/putative hemolysin